jgi:hypothetical protein
LGTSTPDVRISSVAHNCGGTHDSVTEYVVLSFPVKMPGGYVRVTRVPKVGMPLTLFGSQRFRQAYYSVVQFPRLRRRRRGRGCLGGRAGFYRNTPPMRSLRFRVEGIGISLARLPEYGGRQWRLRAADENDAVTGPLVLNKVLMLIRANASPREQYQDEKHCPAF